MQLCRQCAAIEPDLLEHAISEVQGQVDGSVSEMECQCFRPMHLPCSTLQRDGEVVAQIGDTRGSTPG